MGAETDEGTPADRGVRAGEGAVTATPGSAAGARTRLSVDTPAPGVSCIGVHGRLDLLAGVRLLRLLDSRLGVPATGGTRTEQVLVDLTDADGVEHVGFQLLSRAAATAAHHGSGFALLSPEDLRDRCPARDRHHLAGLDVVASVAEACPPKRCPRPRSRCERPAVRADHSFVQACPAASPALRAPADRVRRRATG